MRRIILVLAFCLFPLSHSFAAEPYPNQPITLIVPFAEGSDTDLYAKNLVKHVSKYLNNQPIKIEYIVGETGAVAARKLLAAAPDGYTLLEARGSTQVIGPAINAKIGYSWNSFTTLGALELTPAVCAVNSASPYQNVRQLTAAIRKAPGTLKYGSVGVISTQNFVAQYMLFLSGLKPSSAQAVEFGTGPLAAQSVIEGRVDFICSNASNIVPYIQSGALRGLFSTSLTRLSGLPGLINAREAGLRDMTQVSSWTSLVGPAGLPKEVKQRWKEALNKLARDPGWQEGSKALGALPLITSTPDPELFVQQQYKLYDQLITHLGIRQ